MRARAGVLAAAVLLLTAAPPCGAAAQEPEAPRPERVRALVDYVAGENLYLAAGAEQGVFPGDTLRAFAGGGREPLGALVVVSSTRSRSVAAFAGPPFPVERGAPLFLELPPAALARLRAAAAEREAEAPPPSAPAVAAPAPRVLPRPAPRMDGRLSLDVDGRRTSRNGAGGSHRTEQATPALRLHALASGLPGGVRLTANLRAAYRYSDSPLFGTPGSLRVYQASVEKTFGAVPLRLQAGRFYNPYDSYSGYYDGLLARLGGEGLGIGAAFGYVPDRANEGFSRERPKASVFVDLHHRGAARYDAELALRQERPAGGGSDRRYAALSQRLAWGALRLDGRLLVDRSPATDRLRLADLHAGAQLALAAGWHLHARYAARRSSPLLRGAGAADYRRERATAGISYAGAAASAGVDASVLGREDGRSGRAFSAHLLVPRTPLAGVGLGGNASISSEGGLGTLFASPYLTRAFGRTRVRAAFQYYRADVGFAVTELSGGELSVSFPLQGGTHGLLRAQHQRGDGTVATRLFASLWVPL